IVRIYQPRLLDGRASVEMDYVKGQSLNDYLQNTKCLEMDEFYRLFEQIVGALAYCHHDIYEFLMDSNKDNIASDPNNGQKYRIDAETEKRLVKKYAITHNDIHSNNVMRRDYDGGFVLLDFGLAIQDGNAVRSSARNGGALEYMAPEKFEDNGIINTQSDVYSLGILLYEALAGRVPFVVDKNRFSSNPIMAQYDIMNLHKTAIPPAIEPLRHEAFEAAHPAGKEYEKDYPEWLEDMILKCLEKNPADRYADAKELLIDFKAKRYGEKTDAQPVVRPSVKPAVEPAVRPVVPPPIPKVVQPAVPPTVPPVETPKPTSNPNLIDCPDCGKKISRSALSCPNCGRPMRETTPSVVSIPTPPPLPNYNAPQAPQATTKTDSNDYIDLGLPSGTKWKNANEYGYYNHYDAVNKFGTQLPSKEQWRELGKLCKWTWTGNGCRITGANGNSIFLPAAGFVKSNQPDLCFVGVKGCYRSSTPNGSQNAWRLYFDAGNVTVGDSDQFYGESVRLVKK
ncbi:MAG: protein kinase, partial [Bacteroidales bacterium]|nr:protein kinase [Bacteroidales bacterium]